LAAGARETNLLDLKDGRSDPRRSKKARPTFRSNVPAPINTIFLEDETTETSGSDETETDNR
jgi:hypothetical protein